MASSFFSKPTTLDDWFKIPAGIGALLIGLLAVTTVLIVLPAMVLFISTGGGFDIYICIVLLIVFPLPAWRAWKAISNGRMLRSCLWSLTPPVLLWLIYRSLAG